jgi:hypothetical protein
VTDHSLSGVVTIPTRAAVIYYSAMNMFCVRVRSTIPMVQSHGPLRARKSSISYNAVRIVHLRNLHECAHLFRGRLAESRQYGNVQKYLPTRSNCTSCFLSKARVTSPWEVESDILILQDYLRCASEGAWLGVERVSSRGRSDGVSVR